MGLHTMISKLVERILLYVIPSFKWVSRVVHGSASHDPQASRGGSARLFMGLLAMIPKLVERILLLVTLSFKWVCQIVHGSASHDPQVSRSGSARLSMGLLAMIPKFKNSFAYYGEFQFFDHISATVHVILCCDMSNINLHLVVKWNFW